MWGGGTVPEDEETPRVVEIADRILGRFFRHGTFRPKLREHRRQLYFEQSSEEKRQEQLGRAFDRIYIQGWIIRALVFMATVQLGISKWLASHLWDCLQAAHRMAAVIR